LEVLKMQGQAGRLILLTPHAGEFLRLWNGFYKDVLSMQEFKKSPWDYAKRLAEELSVIIIAKDARTFICAPTRPVCMNLSGNSGMATAGSGDVLAGILTAFVAAKNSEDVFSKACKAVRVHGLLGDAAAKRMGEHAVMASELIP
ncbi:MAG: NAD(P)H-hydrate dehydratase, partial [Lachnospiraceae bacterium]|nr:NAD(P)H-hydrate dehydratase [Lachnospiraceae bacterium]